MLSIGDIEMPAPLDPAAVDADLVEASEVRCPDAETSRRRMKAAIDAARADGESLGGVFCVTATNLVPGLGSYAEADRRLDARLAAAVMSIPAIKGIEIGDGFAGAHRRRAPRSTTRYVTMDREGSIGPPTTLGGSRAG